jgi:hypothetical protein
MPPPWPPFPRYASHKLRFGAFDVCVWPTAAREQRLNSNTWSNQLPSVILYERAKEWGRLPPLEAASDATKRNHYTRVSANAALQAQGDRRWPTVKRAPLQTNRP